MTARRFGLKLTTLHAAICALACSIGACSVNAHVYRALPDAGPNDAAGANTPATNAGAGGAAGLAGAAAFSCPVIAGSPAIAAAPGTNLTIAGVGAPNPSEWLRSGAPCAVDADCAKTLLTPVCDAQTRTCVVCPDLEQQTTLGVRVGVCIGLAVERCCRDVTATVDCFFRDCITACDAQ